MDQAFDLPGADVISVDVHGFRLLAQGRAPRALAVFRANEQKHPREPFWAALGYAQGYTALGDTAKAVKQWEAALRVVPESMRAQRPRYEEALLALKRARGGQED